MREEGFLSIVAEVDGKHGLRDGRLDARPRDCPKCAQRNHAQRGACISCGALMPLPRAK
jgi:hypothetical protein